MTKQPSTIEESAAQQTQEAWSEGHSSAFNQDRKRNPYPKSAEIFHAEWERGWSAGLSSLITHEAEEEVRQRRASIRLVSSR